MYVDIRLKLTITAPSPPTFARHSLQLSPAIPGLYPTIPSLYPVIPSLYPVIPAKAGIQNVANSVIVAP